MARPGFSPTACRAASCRSRPGSRSPRSCGSDGISVVFIGDGTLGEGVVYETLNIASLWQLPLLIVLEDNGWSQSTPPRSTSPGACAGRFEAFGLEVEEVDSTDVAEIAAVARRAVEKVRTARPRVRVHHPHVPALPPLQERRQSAGRGGRGPVGARPARRSRSRLGPDAVGRIDAEVDGRSRRGRAAITSRPWSRREHARALGSALRDAWRRRTGRRVRRGHRRPVRRGVQGDARASTDFPERVRTTPISEAAIAGVAAGLALAGYRPIAEVMFGDFLALCFDQIPHMRVVSGSLLHDPSATFASFLAATPPRSTSTTSCCIRWTSWASATCSATVESLPSASGPPTVVVRHWRSRRRSSGGVGRFR